MTSFGLPVSNCAFLRLQLPKLVFGRHSPEYWPCFSHTLRAKLSFFIFQLPLQLCMTFKLYTKTNSEARRVYHQPYLSHILYAGDSQRALELNAALIFVFGRVRVIYR